MSFPLQIACYLAVTIYATFFLKEPQLSQWMPYLKLIDRFTISIVMIKVVLPNYRKKDKSTPLRRLWAIFSAIRDFYSLIFLFFISLQFIQTWVKGELIPQEFHLEFLNLDIFTEFTVHLVILWIALTLGLFDLVAIVACSTTPIVRVQNSMVTHRLKAIQYASSSKNLEYHYFNHYLRNMFDG